LKKEEVLMEVKKMSVDSTPATKAQIEYIKRLQRKMGIKGGVKKINSLKASRLIGELVSALNSGHDQRSKIDEPRLGMAMTECFRLWKKNGWDIYKKHRNAFIADAVDTYWLFSEIAEKLETDVK
jgi:hypothetical protein